MEVKTIFIAEDHHLVRDAWKLTIENNTDFKIIGESDNCLDTLAFCTNNRVDVIIMDINLKDGSSINTIKSMLDCVPNVNIIVVSMLNIYSITKELYKVGIRAYLTKNSSKDDLISAITKASKRERYFSSEISQLMLEYENETIHTLSSKELKVIRLISKGLSNKEISLEMKMSEKTIEGYKTKIYKKLKVANNIGVYDFALNNGLL